MRSRLLLLIVIPMTSGLVLGGLSIASSVRNALAYQRLETLATLGRHIVSLAQALEDERDQIVVYIAMSEKAGGRAAALAGHASAAAPQLSVINKEIGTTDVAAAQVKGLARQIGGGYSAQAQQAATVALTALAGLPSVRSASIHTRLPALVVVQEYTRVIDYALALGDQVAQASSDAALAQTAQVLNLVSAMQEAASEQRAIVSAALLSGSFAPGQLTALQDAKSAQQSDLTSFNLAASVGQQQIWNTSVDKSFVYLANSEELQAIALQNSTNSVASDPTTSPDWYGAMSNVVDVQMGSVERQLATQAITRAAALRKSAITTAVIIGAAVLLVLLIALILTVLVGRSMIRPLRRLRINALDVAGVRLPETVRRMSELESENISIEVEPIDVDSRDEIGEVARAFDQVHREALRLAATEAALRGNVNAMFVNLSRRSQSLVERQIRLIDELEQGEQDSERLASLFQMDHLATRMRRNSENLLVLAGHESSRRWNQPVPLVDVLRAAISEIEQYERVMLNVQPGIAVRGPAVNDVVHLIAELTENATSFSSADTPVTVSGHMLGSGGVLLDITDEGVGMGGDEMAHANWRLDNPPVVDVAVSRRMGLFVVARLAARHGIRVRLRSASGNGLTALVWLPDEVIVNESASGAGEPGRLPDRSGRFVLEPGGMLGPGPGGGGWSQPGPASAFDEVAAARARFSPEVPESNGDYSRSAFDSRPGFASDPGFGSQPAARSQPAPGQPELGEHDPRLGGQFPDRPSGERMLAGPGFGDRGSDERAFGPTELAGSGADQAVTDNGNLDLGPHRVPGAGPHPGRFSTGPMPAIDTGPRQAVEHPEWFAAAGRRPGIGRDQGSAGDGLADTEQTVTDGLAEPSAPAPAERESTQERAASSDGQTDQHAQPVFGAPITRSLPLSGTFRTDSQFGAATGGVIVPPPASLGDENRLPIFEAVESDWFRRGRPTVDWGSGHGDRAATRSWSSPADEGWRAAEVAAAPASGGITVAGLPRRVPQANLIPGTAAEAPAPMPVARSAAATRERFASLQRGMREGRAATGIDRTEGTGEVPGDG